MLTIIIVLGWLGLAFGSFVNALVWRLREQSKSQKPKAKKQKLSVFRGRSMCVHCRHQLSIADLIPVFSWLARRGKCRYCHRPISWQYPVVELLTAILFVISYVFWPYDFDALGIVRFVIWLGMLIGFMALVVYDLRWMLLPNRIIYPLIGLAVTQVIVLSIFSPAGAGDIITGVLWGLAIAGGLFYLLFQFSNGRWIGGGDVKLGFLLGLIVGGPINSLLVLFMASTLGTLVIMPLLLTGKATRQSRIPFGPFLIAAAVIALLFGNAIFAWYNRLLVMNA